MDGAGLSLAMVEIPPYWPGLVWLHIGSSRPGAGSGGQRDVLDILLRNLSSYPYIGPGRTIVAAGKFPRTADSPAALER